MISRKSNRPRVVLYNKEEEVLEVEEYGPLTMWDLAFDLSAVPNVVRKSALDAASFLHWRRKA